MRWWAALVSALVPGLGQLLCGRVAVALLFLWGGLWTHALAFGAVRAARGEADLVASFLFGAFGAEGGLRVPEAVGLTVVALGLHLWSSVDAAWPGPGEAPKTTGEVGG